MTRKERRTCSRPAAPMRAISSGLLSRWRSAEGGALDRVHGVAGDVVDDLLREPAREAARPRACPSTSPRPPPSAKPSCTDFCSTMVAARCSALICTCASGGSSSTVMSGSWLRGLAQLGQDLAALAVAVAGAGQHQPHVVVLAHQPVRVDDAERILGGRERRHLQQDRPVLGRRRAPRRMRGHLARGQVAVLLRQRVDRGRDDVLAGCRAAARTSAARRRRRRTG